MPTTPRDIARRFDCSDENVRYHCRAVISRRRDWWRLSDAEVKLVVERIEKRGRPWRRKHSISDNGQQLELW
jgi:hypothetical protein